MGVLPELIWIGLHLSCVAIDMALILMLLRIVGQWQQVERVEKVKRVANEVVNRLTATITRQWQALTSVRLSQKGVLALSVATLCLARLLLDALVRLIWT